MFNYREYYEKENAEIDKEYQESIAIIDGLIKNESGILASPYREFFIMNGKFLLSLCAYEEKIGSDYFFSKPLNMLSEENLSFFRELDPAHYETSYANPTYSAAVFGKEIGGLMSSFHVQNRQHIRYASRHERFEMLDSHKTFINAFLYLKTNKPEYEPLKDIITVRFKKDRTDKNIHILRENFGSEFNLLESDDSIFKEEDPRYLFFYGMRVSNVEINTAKFINALPQADIDRIAHSVADAYTRGFSVNNKDRTGRTVCSIWGSLGQERIYQRLIAFLTEKGFNGTVKNLSSPPLNRQYWFDHRFDEGLYLTENLTVLWESAYRNALEACKGLYPRYSGSIYFDSFGEKPFSPQMKTESTRFSEDQKRLYSEFHHRMNELREVYIPRGLTSFSAIAFPSTEIGDQFQDIFREMIAINTLDTDKYSAIQQKIIDVLDMATSIQVTGKGDNHTNIAIRLHSLVHPDKETNFFNCGADVNIPVGEVFTTPKLEGTNGKLHIKEAYLSGYFFRDLTLIFKDGYISDYSCLNHSTAEDNRKYIEENLLFPHKTLPLGEFAIGTNTKAFAMSRHFGLIDKLPVLIIEKMGPHFAIGDSCYSHEEDTPVYNILNKKEITARDNEKSILRKTDSMNAYTFKHMDITLPFHEIGSISAVMPDGKEKEIIKDGFFVLPGTEELNMPLRELRD